MMRLLLSVGMVFVLGIQGSICLGQMPPSSVYVMPVEEKDSNQRHRVIGSLRAISRSDVAALEEGRIDTILVREGARLKAGDVIAQIDDRRLRAQLEEASSAIKAAEAVVDERQAELNLKNREFDRAATLVQRSVITTQEYDEVNANVKIAEARLESSKRDVARLERQLELLQVREDDMTVKAPFDAFVVARHAEPGEWIKPGEPLLTLTSTGRIEAWVDVPERFAAVYKLRQDEPIVIEVAATGKKYPVLGFKRIADVHPQTRMLQFALEVDNSSEELVAGMSVIAWVPVGDRVPRKLVSRAAVIYLGEGAYVYKIVTDEKGQQTAIQTQVKPVYEINGQVAVESAELAASDAVVVEGNERLMPGSPVIATPYKPSQPTEGSLSVKAVN